MYDNQPISPQVVNNRPGSLLRNKRAHRSLNRKTNGVEAFVSRDFENNETIAITPLHFPFLRGILNGELQDINSRVVNQKYRKKEYIYLPHQRNQGVFFIIHGNVEIGYLDESGRELSLDILGAGEVFGCFMGRNFSFRSENPPGDLAGGEFARSLDKSVVAIINKDDFETFLEKFPRFAFRMLKLVSTRINTLETKLQNLVFSDVKTRICKLLYSLYHKAGDRESGQIKIPLTHQDIANLVASSRETASLHLSELKKNGTIAYERKRIRVLSLNDLQKYSA